MEILHCPFCGGKDVDFQYGTPDREGIPINCICEECGATGPWEYAKSEEDTQGAIKLWNERVKE